MKNRRIKNEDSEYQTKNQTDWRLVSYDGSLNGKEFDFVKFTPTKNDHEHCEMCGVKITDLIIKNEETVDFGYVWYNPKSRQSNWLCSDCFNSFCDVFNFKKSNNL